jgi:hypothetical protein
MKNIKESWEETWGDALLQETLFKKAEETMGKMNQMLEEADAPVGSHEYIRSKVQTAIQDHPKFKPSKENPYRNAYIRYAYPDHVVAEAPDNKLYHVPYTTNADGEIELGEPKEVEEQTVIKPKGDCSGTKESDIKEAVWDTAYINDLPDSSFAYIEDGGEKDSDGKTTPRSKRHLPYKGSDGKVDLPHLRNALARLPQTNISAEAKASAGAKLKAAAKAAKIGEFAESGFEITDLQEAQAMDDFQISDFVSLAEAEVSPDGSKVKVVLIEAGTNEGKKRHYPDEAITEAATGFKGLKQYINHPTKTEEKERPERDIRDWASTITESYAGKSAKTGRAQAIGEVSVHDSWLRERLKDPVFRANVGLSINTGGMISQGKVNGQDMDIVEKIVFARKNGPASVDWVTEPGARGRVAGLLESRYEREQDMDLEKLTEKDLREARADLVEAIGKTATKDLQEKLQASEKKVADFEKAAKIQKQGDLVEAAIKKDGIPEAAKVKIREHFKTTFVEGDETVLKEAIAAELKKELEYIGKITGKGKIKMGPNGEPLDVKESIQHDLEERAGVSDEQLEKEKNKGSK